MRRTHIPVIRQFATAVLLVGALLGFSRSAMSQALTVARVIDGDTYELSDGQVIRLIGVDTPESHYSYKLVNDSNRSSREAETIRKYGILATKFASDLALGKSVQLVYDPANTVTQHKDRFGRTLAYINILDERGNPIYCLNDRLIFEGVANAYVKYPYARMDWFRTAERTARIEERGFWDPDFDPNAALNYRAESEVLYVTRTGSKYHRAHCSSLRYSRVELQRHEGNHSYSACKICKPPSL